MLAYGAEGKITVQSQWQRQHVQRPYLNHTAWKWYGQGLSPPHSILAIDKSHNCPPAPVP